jgi:hypothetical protein
MADNKLLQQMLEHLVNEDQQKAEELFHEYVVTKSREIYEELIEAEIVDTEDEDEDEDVEEAVDSDEDSEIDEMFDEVAIEADDEADDLLGDVEVDDEDEDDHHSDIGGNDELESKVMDLEDAVEELEAKFAELKSGDDDMDDMDMDDMGDDDSDMGDMGDEEDEVKDSFDAELATVREYVEKVGAKMGDNGANTKSIVAGKNDMGGTTANIVKGGTSDAGGTKGGLSAPSTKEDNAGNVNVPGGKAGVKHLSKEPGHGAEKKASGDNGDKSAQSLFRGRK